VAAVGSRPAATGTASTVPVSARVGLVGAGQLARMTSQAAIPLGVEVRVLAAGDGDPANLAAGSVLIGEADNIEDLRRLAAGCDAVTFDHEGVPPELLSRLEEEGIPLRPGAAAKLVAQDKLHARRLLGDLGLPVPAFEEMTEGVAIEEVGERLGWPLVLKASTGGYDGRGVEVVADAEAAHSVLGRGGKWIAEEFIELELELAQVVVRSPDGSAVAYPLARTVQRNGICHEIHVPAPVGAGLAERARGLALEIAETIDAVGVVAVELFVRDGELLVNELALRPHNSGHFTIEGCVTSQFENHLRAVLGWPLGRTDPRAPAVVTLNVLAEGADPLARLPQALQVPGAHVHLYGKVPHAGRKVGHVTALADQPVEALAVAERARDVLLGRSEP
jgi:5-(carboxyamino)imidazole ribonucleotide synthase